MECFFECDFLHACGLKRNLRKCLSKHKEEEEEEEKKKKKNCKNYKFPNREAMVIEKMETRSTFHRTAIK